MTERYAQEKRESIQDLINKFGFKLRIDGIIGFQTLRALSRLPKNSQDLVKASAAIKNIDLPAIYPWPEIEAHIVRVSKQTGVPESYLDLMVKLENKTHPHKGVLVSIEGSHKGIAQFDAATWDSCSPIPYRYVYDVRVSLLAAAELYLRNKASFFIEYHKGIYSDEVAYLYHNQGAGSASLYLQRGDVVHHRQSDSALAVLKTARSKVLRAMV